MTQAARERLAQHAKLVEALGPTLVARGVLQHFFVSPALPHRPLRLEEIGAAWRRHVEDVRAQRAPELAHLYIHVPFCAHRCRYCVYYSVGEAEAGRIDAYLERLHADLDYYGPIVRDLSFTTCYFGGGTPTLLSEHQLDDLLDHLDATFARRRGGEWGFECNPLTVTAGKARVFRAHGFNRASFGVQTLNPEVLDGVNRGYQSYVRVAETFRVLKEMKFWINVDLIYGLPGESRESALRSFEQLLGFEPGQVTIYAISPYTPIDGLDPGRLGPIAEALGQFMPIAERHGYRGGASTTCLYFMTQRAPRDNLLILEGRHTGRHVAYDDTTVEPFSLLGLGPTARCYIYGQLRYMLSRYPVDEPFDGTATCATGRPVSLDEERRRFVVHQLERPTGLRSSEFARLFGRPLGEVFADELDSLLELGLLEHRQGALMHVTADPGQRFATELFFVPPSMVNEALVQHEIAATESTSAAAATPPEEAAGVEESADGPKLSVRAANVEVKIILADYWPGRPCYHHRGAYAFFVPSNLPEGTCRLGNNKEQLLVAFRLLFDRVVERDAPADCARLLCALEAEIDKRRGVTISRVT